MDVAYLFIDEADHFDKFIQEELEPAITAYEEKSKGKTIMASTQNRPDGLFERIEKIQIQNTRNYSWGMN